MFLQVVLLTAYDCSMRDLFHSVLSTRLRGGTYVLSRKNSKARCCVKQNNQVTESNAHTRTKAKFGYNIILLLILIVCNFSPTTAAAVEGVNIFLGLLVCYYCCLCPKYRVRGHWTGSKNWAKYHMIVLREVIYRVHPALQQSRLRPFAQGIYYDW